MSDSNEPTIDEQITALTEKWYRYVGLDHHKDRDCHFFVEKKWSYGDPPVYTAHHEGYVLEYWTGPARKNYSEAQADLFRFLSRARSEALDWANRLLSGEDEADDWDGLDAQTVLEIFQ